MEFEEALHEAWRKYQLDVVDRLTDRPMYPPFEKAILTAHRAEVERERREFVSKGLPEKHEHWVCSGCEAQLDTAKGEGEDAKNPR